MGTTLTALQSSDGVELQAVVAIEGISYLLTDGSTSRAVTAWSGTDWSTAIGGLFLDWGGMGQRMQPWDAELSVPIVRLAVMDYDGSDTFGKAVFASSGGTVSRLTTEMDANDTLFDVQRADAFAASGEVHIGTECIEYSSRDTGIDRFTVSKRGKYAPFVGTASGFGHTHQLPVFTDGVRIKADVCSQPRTWAGRWVGIWLHRVVGGVLDVKAQAQLVFAGRIGSTSDDANGVTWVEVVDCRSALKDCVILRDQWTATLADGIYLRAGTQIDCTTTQSGTASDANPLVVVSSGASGANQINEGVATYETLVGKINEWLASEKTASRIDCHITFSLRQRSDGFRTVITSSVNGTAVDVQLVCLSASVFRFLGWAYGTERILCSTASEEVSQEVPFRRLSIGSSDGSVPLNVANERGSFIDNKERFPAEMGMTGSESGTFGVVQTESGAMMLVKKSAGQISPVVGFSDTALASIEYLKTLSGEYVDFDAVRDARMDETGTPTLRQVALIDGKLSDVLPWLFFSTGVSGYNHATYDVLPNQLGAGIPKDLISNIPGDLAALSTPQAPCRLVIEKPTPLWNIVEPELVLRSAACVWKNQGLRLISWSTPTTTTAVHNFTMANKARPADEEDNMRTVAHDDDLHARNMIRIQYNRRLKGQGDTYEGTFTLADTSSMDEIGQRPVTIKASNTFAGLAGGVDAIEELATHLASFAPLWTRPLRVLTRPISLPHYENVAPGDHCTISDDHVRDPSTGTRGISGRPGLILSHRVDWGGFGPEGGADRKARAMRGEVTILIFPRNQVTVYSPCAQVDHTAGSGGWDGTTLTLKPHEHSESTDAVDSTHFADGDVVRIVEIDPATAASPTTWTRTIGAVGTNTMEFTAALSSPSWDSAKKYRVISDTYANAVSTQKADCYQADDADGLIADLAQAYEYGFGLNQGTTWTDEAVSTQAALYSTYAYGDGKPLDVGYERDCARLVNNFVSHRSAPSMPRPLTLDAQGTASKVRSVVLIQRVCIGPGLLGGQRRKLWVRPMYKSSDGSSATLTVTLCRKRPTGNGRHITSSTTPEYTFPAPSQSNTWTTTSTTLAAGTAFGYSLAHLDADGKGWLVFECTPKMITRGTAVCRVGGLYEL